MTEINNGFKIYSQVLVLKSLKLNIARVLVPLPVSLITRAQARSLVCEVIKLQNTYTKQKRQ